jgi:hypothetical protein
LIRCLFCWAFDQVLVLLSISSRTCFSIVFHQVLVFL